MEKILFWVRSKENKECGASNKILVFGILEREGKVRVEIVEVNFLSILRI
ncbi:MAG: hypothetical protein ACK4F9_07705 [Brevinematia bacterium]